MPKMVSSAPLPTDLSSTTSKLDSLHLSTTELPTTPQTQTESPNFDLETKLLTLKSQLSGKSLIVLPSDAEYKELTQRWSDFNAIRPGAVVNIGCEEDICTTIKFANAHSLPILAQSGGHAFTSRFASLPPTLLLLNLRPMNTVAIDLPSGHATLDAGTLTGEVLAAAHAAGAHIVTGVCDTVGILPALLGGGLGNLISMYGLGVDNILEVRLVTAEGDVVVVSGEDIPGSGLSEEERQELWWGLRGAGWNFGIVSQMKVKAYKQVNEGLHWTGMLGFPGTKEVVETVLGALERLDVGWGMGVTVIFARMPPVFEPMLVLSLFYAGSHTSAHAAFSPLFALSNPILNVSSPTPYPQINASNAQACLKGGRKPVFSVGLKESETGTLPDAWDLWERFTGKNEGTRESVVLVERYGYGVARELGEKSEASNGEGMVFPWRQCGVHVVGVMNYEDAKLDEEVKLFGDEFRDTLRARCPHGEKRVYANFAHGDEDPETLYGGKVNVERLRKLKERWDAKSVFGWYNPFQ